MPKIFISSVLFFLLLGAGYGILVAAQPTPWDCSDWQAFAHDDRPTAILESLAANRGKTLYCGVDQSDTFTKAETWQAGKDRNERDDTVYYGEGGHFRGFIAAQEGWLTDGESGITGQSIAVIFEFPRPQRQGRRTKRKLIPIFAFISSCGHNQYGSPIAPTNPVGNTCPNGYGQSTQSINQARNEYNNNIHPHIRWPALAKSQAHVLCRNRHGYPLVTGISIDEHGLVPGHTAYAPNRWEGHTGGGNYNEWQVRRWEGYCLKKVKGSRRD